MEADPICDVTKPNCAPDGIVHEAKMDPQFNQPGQGFGGEYPNTLAQAEPPNVVCNAAGTHCGEALPGMGYTGEYNHALAQADPPNVVCNAAGTVCGEALPGMGYTGEYIHALAQSNPGLLVQRAPNELPKEWTCDYGANSSVCAVPLKRDPKNTPSGGASVASLNQIDEWAGADPVCNETTGK